MIKGDALNSKLMDTELVILLTHHCLLMTVIKPGLGWQRCQRKAEAETGGGEEESVWGRK